MENVNTYGQYFTLSSPNFSKLKYAMYEFNKRMITFRMAVERTGKFTKSKVVSVPDKFYYTMETEDPVNVRSKDIIRYPIGIYDEVMRYLISLGYDMDAIEVVHHTPHKGTKIKIKSNPDYTPRDYQETYIQRIVEQKHNNILIDLATGKGKMMTLDTAIRIKGGWKYLADLSVGDKVIGRDGLECNVTDIHPHLDKDIYRVIFEDGRYADVGLEHLWGVYINNRGGRVTCDTSTIIRRMQDEDECHIDLPIPEDFSTGRDTGKGYKAGIALAYSMKLPEEYLTGSLRDRLYLLSGIVDAVGKLTSDGYMTLAVCDEETIINVLSLIRSVGGLAYTGKFEKCTVITFFLSKTILDLAIIPSNLYDAIRDVGNRIKVLSVIPLGKSDMACITVDNDDALFVINDYVVTHNTYIAMNAMSRIKEKFALVILPRYIDKWIGDVTHLTDIKEEEILVVKGITNLINLLLNKKKVTAKYKCFIFSLTTVSMFIKSYLHGTDVVTAKLSPEDIFERLGVSVVISDESHQEFYNVFHLMLFSNIRLFIGLTATLVSRDGNLERMYLTMFPESNRASNIVKQDRYVNVLSIKYRLRNKQAVRFRNNYGYNQAVFEQSIIKHSVMLNGYLEMLAMLTNTLYIRRRQKGEKLLIFMGRVAMCETMVKFLRRKNYGLVINSYTEKDDYQTILNSDITVSTIPSSGTALDIPDLITVIQTVNVDSIGANKQTIGRLREIKGREVYFAYTWSSDISSHNKYNLNRYKLFSKQAKSIKSTLYPKYI